MAHGPRGWHNPKRDRRRHRRRDPRRIRKPQLLGYRNGTAGLLGLLLTLLAFIIGGYVAGRLASRSGLKHGVLVPVVALVGTIVLAGIGTLLGLSFIDNLRGVTLPNAPSDVPQDLGTILTGAGILALLMPFVGEP